MCLLVRKMPTTRIFSALFIVIFAFISESYCAPPESSNATIKDYCIKETKVSKTKIDELEENPDKNSTDEEILCYTHCIMVTMGVIDDDGAIIIKEFTKYFDNFDIDCLKEIPIIENCTDLVALNECGLD